MEWKTAKEIASELGVTQSAVYEGIKRGGKVGGEMLEKGGPGGRRYRIKTVAKPRIPKPPLTISEEASGLDLLAGDVSAGVVVRLKRAEEELRRLTERLAADESYIFTAKEEITKLREEAANSHKDHKIDAHCLADRIAKFEKLYQEPREDFDIRRYLDGKVKEHVEMMIKATFELPDHGSDIERLGDRIDRVSDKLTERLDLWTSKLEDVDRSVSEYVDRELTRRFDVEPWKNPDGEIEEIKSRIAKLQDRLAEAATNGKEYRNQVNERLDLQHNIQGQLLASMRELKGHAQDNVERILVLEKGEEYFKEKITGILNDVGAAYLRIDDLEENKGDLSGALGQLNEIEEYLANSTTNFRVKTLEDLNIHARLNSLESFEQEFARRVIAEGTVLKDLKGRIVLIEHRLDLQHKIQGQHVARLDAAEEKVTAIISGRPALDTKERIDGINARLLEVEETLKAFNWDGLDGRPKRGEVIGLIRGGVQEELKRIGKQEDNQSKAILNDIGRLFKRVVDLESTRTLDEEFKRDTNRSIETLIKNVMRLQGLSVDKTPSAADIMKRTVKAASAFADAMEGDL